MTINGIENWFIGGVGAVVAALLGTVRNGDLKRIEAVEKKQELQDDHIASEIHTLRTEMRDNHSELMTYLVKR